MRDDAQRAERRVADPVPSPAQVRELVGKIRTQTAKPLNLNFFCHMTQRDAALEATWLEQLASYYTELGVSPPAFPASARPPFGPEMCGVVEELKPQVVNFGLPDFFTLSPTSDRDRQRLATLVADAVRVYEPRLQSPAVDIASDPSRSRKLVVVVHGTLIVDDLPEPVSFALRIEERGGRVEAVADGSMEVV